MILRAHAARFGETLGAIERILPGLLRIHTELTPVAAVGLVIIMIGATIVTAMGGAIALAMVPFIVGVLAAAVAYGRSRPGHPAPA